MASSTSALRVLPALAVLLLAGCAGTTTDSSTTSSWTTTQVESVPMTFKTYTLPAVHQGHGLYEPTLDVSDKGVLWVSAHSTGVDGQGAPVYRSTDDGVTWTQAPLAATVAAPASNQAGTPPPSDEIFVVAGSDGTAWGVDVTLASYPVHGWCDDGARNCYYNPNAYNRADTSACSASSLNDRPWAAYANGTLLMVNNPGGNYVQVAALKVPPAEPAGLANPVTGPKWNLCAGNGGGSIPGIPGMRDDLFFAVPQTQNGKVVVVTGNARDVMAVQQRDVMAYGNTPASQAIDSGQAAFDATGRLFVTAGANNGTGSGHGGIALAFSDNGINFTATRLAFDLPVSSIYIDGNPNGPGLLLNWGLVDKAGTDWYFGHVFVEEGKVVLRNVSKAVDDGPEASRHVQGAAVGPDGRAYMVMSAVSGNDDAAMVQAVGTTPLSVVVQTAGPVLPGAPAAAAKPA